MFAYIAGESACSRQHTSYLSPSGLRLLLDGRSEVHQHAVLGARSRGPAQRTHSCGAVFKVPLQAASHHIVQRTSQ